jgi:hypothetical protein
LSRPAANCFRVFTEDRLPPSDSKTLVWDPSSSYGNERASLQGWFSKGSNMQRADQNIDLFRGISVPASESSTVIRTLQEKGIAGDESGRNWIYNGNKKKLDQFFEADASLEEIHPSRWVAGGNGGGHREDIDSFPITFACGDELGASYYALVHHSEGKAANFEPLVIEFRAKLEDVFVDPRDFLCSCFQSWDLVNRSHIDLQSRWLAVLYGGAVLKYFHRACSSSEQKRRIELCNLASWDDEVIVGHAAISVVYRGRYGTTCSSSFKVRCPIYPEDIIEVRAAVTAPSTPILSLEEFIGGTLPQIPLQQR